MSPTPESQRVYHARLETRGGVQVIDEGDVLVETIAPWQTWIGKPGGEVVHSTKFFPPERLLVPKATADRLVAGNAAKIIPEPKRRKRKVKKEGAG